MFASWCFSAWKWPIVTPNCSRVFAYATAISTQRAAPPKRVGGEQHERRRRARGARRRRRPAAAPPAAPSKRTRPTRRVRSTPAIGSIFDASARRLDEREPAAGDADHAAGRPAPPRARSCFDAGERASGRDARHSSGCQPPPGSAKRDAAERARPPRARGSQRRCCSGCRPRASARRRERVAEERARARRPRRAPRRPARGRGARGPRRRAPRARASPATPSSASPRQSARLVVLGALEELAHARRRALVREELAHRLLEQLLLLGETEVHGSG